nr:MliC family protein [uncultured Haemophilus sp.]
MSLKKFHWGWMISALFMLSGCAEVAVSPVEQVQQVQQASSSPVAPPKTVSKRSVVKNEAISLYLCKDDKEVRVLKSKSKKNAKSTVAVTFMGTTHTLSAAVTKNGKKYSNIRWVWWEPREGDAELYDNNKQILAEACVKQR